MGPDDAIRKIQVWLLEPVALVALTVTGNVPNSSDVPEITPSSGFKLIPKGRLVAVKVNVIIIWFGLLKVRVVTS